MSRCALIGICGLAGALGAAPASAEPEHPLYVPTRDVAVTYNLDHAGAGSPKQAHLYYSSDTNRLRLETPATKGFVLIDRAAKVMTVVMAPQHIYFDTPLDPEMAAGFLLNERMKFARGGSETIAGLQCTDWDVETAQAKGKVCVTDDGVLLLGRGREKEGTEGGGLEAVEISYAPQPSTLFVPPAGFRKIDISEAPPPQPR
jgi:uncharacterized protein DUF4412